MKKWLLYGVNLAILVGAGMLFVSAPDVLSMIVVGFMLIIVLMAVIFGVVPVIQYSAGFDNAIRNCADAQEAQSSMPWLSVSQLESFFGQKLLDRLFDEYKRKVEQERRTGMIVGGIDEAINEDELALRCWHGVLMQIPGILTGLGLLGTFIGLITGISSIEVSSVDAALESVKTLFDGIQVAFFTSISGIILSIVFNIMYRIVWNIMVRDLEMFTALFQRNIIPSVEEQTRYLQKKDMQQIQERLDRLPQSGGFSLSNAGKGFQPGAGSESVLMPQVLSGMQNGEFTFYLQPRYDLNTHRIIGAEALVRWKHPKLGMVAPSVFIPVLEDNGYITKLDQYIWNQICAKMREWLDAGLRPVPIAVNISKTDILALEVAESFSELIEEYRLPPRCLEFDVAQNAYFEARNITAEFEKQAQQKGFRVVVDGFTGDFFALQGGELPVNADAYKLDLRFCKDSKSIGAIASQAGNMKISLLAEGIENMEQMSILRKSGIIEGQGYYLSKAVSVEEFEKMMNWGADE